MCGWAQVSSVTGLTLRSVSASCSLYGPGDHLLVHDDLLADRRVAFILYLAPWRPRASAPATTTQAAPAVPASPSKPVENGDGDHHEATKVWFIYCTVQQKTSFKCTRDLWYCRQMFTVETQL